MAILKHTFLGLVSGRLGDIVLKNRKGTQYVCAAPTSFNKSNTKDAIDSRNVFAITSLMYSALGKNYIIKNIWDNWNFSKGNYVNKLKLYNKGKVKGDLDLSKVSFVPCDNPFTFDLISVTRNGIKVSVTTSLPKNVSWFSINSRSTLQGVIHCTREADTFKKSNIFVPVDFGEVLSNENDNLTFTTVISNAHYAQLQKCNHFTLYVDMIVKNTNGMPYKFSTVANKELI